MPPNVVGGAMLEFVEFMFNAEDEFPVDKNDPLDAVKDMDFLRNSPGPMLLLSAGVGALVALFPENAAGSAGNEELRRSTGWGFDITFGASKLSWRMMGVLTLVRCIMAKI